MKKAFLILLFFIGQIINIKGQKLTIPQSNSNLNNNSSITINVSKSNFAEDESAEITANIDQAVTNNTYIPFNIGGTAIGEKDYTASFASKGEESVAFTLSNSYYNRFVQLADGRYVFLNSNNNLIIYNPVTQTQTLLPIQNYVESVKVVGNILYFIYSQSISKIDFSQNNPAEVDIVSLSNQNSYIRSFDVVGETIYYVENNYSTNSRKIYSKTGTADQQLIYETTLSGYFLSIDSMGVLYIGDSGNIQKIDINKNSIKNIAVSGFNISKIKMYNDQLYILGTDYSGNYISKIKKLNFGNNSFENFDFVNANTTSNISINDFIISKEGDLQVLRTPINQTTIYNYQLSPQIKIPSGSTTGKITFSGIDDESDEPDETIILTPGTVANAAVSSITPITLTMSDNDEAPTVSFALSANKIVENSSTTVTLTATPSVVSGKEITIPFTLDGTAKINDEYTVSSNQIVIPANAASGSVTISTSGKDDSLVEVLETIIFKIGTLANATSATQSVTLNLESDDDPILTGISATKLNFVEHESTEITATINEASSRDVVIPITVSGTAKIDSDYTASFASKGEESVKASLSGYYFKFVQLEDGRYVFSNGNTLIIYNPTTQAQTSFSLQNNVGKMKAVGNVLYFNYSQSISKIDFSQNSPTEVNVVSLSNQNSSLTAFDIVGQKIYYAETNYSNNSKKIYSKVGTAAPSIIYEPTIGINYLFVDSMGLIYIGDAWNLQKIDTNKNLSYNIGTSGASISNAFLYGNQLYIVDNYTNSSIKKFNSRNNTFENLDFTNTNTNLVIHDFSFSKEGNLQVLRNQNIQTTIYNYQLSPQLKIPAGSTTGKITFSGIDDESDEPDETIILTPGTVANAAVSSITPITLTMSDNDEAPTVSFALSANKIVENSSTTVTLTATPSVVSGKEITIPFTLDGTAKINDEYTVSSNQIVIPANAASGSVTISTSGKDDSLVEVLETIIFKIGTLANATSATQSVTLNLESDDDPILTGISATKLNFAEHESTEITATINEASSRDVIIPLEVTGTATLDADYTASFASKGEEWELATISNNSSSFVRVADGRYVFLNSNSTLNIYNPLTKTSSILNLNNYYDRIEAENNIVYLKSWSPGKIDKIDFSQNTLSVENVVDYGSGFGLDRDIQVVGNKIYYVKISFLTNIRKIYSKTGNSAEVERYQTTDYFENFIVDQNDNIYFSNYNSVYKVLPNNEKQYLFSSENQIVDLGFYNSNIYAKIQNGNVFKISKLDLTKNILTDLSYKPSNTDNILDFSIDTKGNLFLLKSLPNSNTENILYSYQLSPQIKILAGNTTGKLIIKGVEDELNFEGQETDETIVLNFSNPVNAQSSSSLSSTIQLKILNNQVSLTSTNAPFMGVENGAVSWGDFDRDGDQDVAIMGTGASGAVTKLYENKNGTFVDKNQNFTRLYLGDISWVDINKDGWLDLAISGFDGKSPVTKIYINEKGESFSSAVDFGLPQLYSSKMAWGDLENDGDIDLAITGIDANEKYQFFIYYRDDNQNKFTLEPKSSNYQGVINGDIKIVDVDLDGDNDIVYNGESSNNNPMSLMGNVVGNTIYNTYIKTSSNNSPNYNYGNSTLSLKGAAIEVAKLKASQNTLTVLASGIDYTGAIQFYSSDNSLIYSGPMGSVQNDFPKLKNGDIAVADFNNDGLNDILFTGEDASGIPQTKLYYQNSSGVFKLSPITLEGLRNSTANWVDYDMDGDLDLFITGIAASGGAKTLLYKSEILNKPNTAPQKITGLVAEDLGNGKIKFKWDVPSDDFGSNLGYVVRVGMISGGTELSNTESNLETGARLITKQAPIYTNFYEMQLDPGKYYWSVQAVDTGLKGGYFSEENNFTLTYDWKILNQGGIIDRSITGIANPVIKLGDIDNDKDQDLVYANSDGTGSQLLQFDGKRLVSSQNNDYLNPGQINYLNNINSADIGDVDGDGKADILINYYANGNKLALTSVNGGYTQVGDGLYKAKTRIIDINNDGKLDVVVLGNSSNMAAGVPKLWIYEYDKSTSPPSFKKTDASSSIASLSNSSFDFGDIDKDQDIDLVITGFSAIDGLKSIIYENKTVLGESLVLSPTTNNIVAIKDGTTDLIDFDGDGDLDVVLTGTSINGDVFEIYMNKLNEGIKDWPRFSSGLTPIRNSKIDLGDFNGDGFADLLYSGISGGGTGQVTKLSEYNKSTQSYQDSAFDVSDFSTAEVEFGDIDGDDDLDFVIVGTNKNWNSNSTQNVDKYIFRTYLNVRNDSAKILSSSKNKNANKAEANTIVYNFNEAPAVPIIPNNATKLLTNVSTKSGTYPIELNWEASTDDHTPSAGLTYAIKIGTTPGGEEVMSANSNQDGTRKVSEKGNVEHNTKWRLSLPVGNYYWSVQAIDAAYSGSVFSAPQKIQVTSTGVTFNNPPKANADQITLVEGGFATKLDTNEISVLKNDTDAENNTLTAVLVSNVSNGTLTLNADGTFKYIHNGSQTSTDSFTYKANDGTSDSNIVTVNIIITPFSIPYNNFSIEGKSETCSGKNNGEINIAATQSFNYVAKINGKDYDFNNNKLSVVGLAPGTYSVCITIPGKTFEQCYNVIIGKGGSLTGKISTSKNAVSVSISEGTAPYSVFVNGTEKLETTDKEFIVEANQWDLVEVKTAVACEGVLSKTITESVAFGVSAAYPNPTKGEFYISVPDENKEIAIEVYSQEGRLILKQKPKVISGRIKLDLTNNNDGIYMVKVMSNNPKIIKIIKTQ